jgi:hypothetical protein
MSAVQVAQLVALSSVHGADDVGTSSAAAATASSDRTARLVPPFGI